MNIDLNKIGNFLYEQRDKKGITQEQLAAIVGVSYKTISKWERGGGFPDVSYQLSLCNALNISLKELQMGCLDLEERNRKRCLIFFANFSFFFILVIIPFFIMLLIFFTSHVGKPKFFQITSNSLSAEIGKVQGILIESYKNNYLMINNISLKNNDKSNYLSVDLYSDNRVIYHNNDIEPFSINYSNDSDVNHKNLKLVIINSNDFEEKKYEIKLDVNNSIKSNSIIDNKKYNYDTIRYDLNKRLLSNGFRNVVGDIWYKNITNKLYNIDIHIYANTNRISYIKNTQEITAELLYYQDYNVLEAIIYSDEILKAIVEKYTYNYNNQELDCKIGICASYQKAIKDIEEYISLLKVE